MPSSPAPASRNKVVARSNRGFALLITITLLAFLVLLLVSLASLTRVETQVAANSQSLAQARQNALFALNIAMGQLQRYAGADQRITAPATTVYPQKDVTKGTGPLYDDPTFGYRRKATTSSARSYLTRVETYLTPTERSGTTGWEPALRAYWNNNATADSLTASRRNPHWLGVFDASLRVDRATNPNGTPAALARQSYETNPATTFGEPKRNQLPAWLVSGNEIFNFDPAVNTTYPAGYFTPDVPLPDPGTDNTIVYLVGAKSATLPNTSTDGLDGRVKVKKMSLRGTPPGAATEQDIGHYAFWVGDESLKANFAIQDPYAGSAEDSVAYRNRLQVPQRLGWNRMTGFTASTLDVNSPDFLKIVSTTQIPLIDATLIDTPPDPDPTKTDARAPRGPLPRNFHTLTGFSRSLFTDTALGGLRKDLTHYLTTGSGLIDSSPIAAPNLYANNDPRFRAWNGTNAGFPASITNVPTWGQLRGWYNNEAGASDTVTPTGDIAPVMTYIMFHGGWSYHNQKIRWHWLPCIVLWNPYDVGLDAATYNMTVELGPAVDGAFVVNDKPTWDELGQDTDADWRAITVPPDSGVLGPDGQAVVQKVTPTSDDPSGIIPYKNLSATDPVTIQIFKGTYVDGNLDTHTRYFPKLTPTNGPDSVDMRFGPWPFETPATGLDNGTSDAFGRYWYRLKPTAPAQTYNEYYHTGTKVNKEEEIPPNHNALGDKSHGLRLFTHSTTGYPQVISRVLRFNISGSFNAGEVKVFTLPSRRQWNPSEAVTLTNNFDVADPSSLWIDIIDVVNGPATSKTFERQLKFHFGQISETIAAPRIDFSVGGQRIMRTERFGTAGFSAAAIQGTSYADMTGYGSNGGADKNANSIINREETGPKFVDTWRNLYDFDQFDDPANMLTNSTNNPRSSIFPYGATWLQPLTNSGGEGSEQLHTYLPVFSRFNIAAKSLAHHPLVDAVRSQHYVNNSDTMIRFDYTRTKDIWNAPEDSKWFDNQTTGTNGFALITPKDQEQIDGANFLGQSVLSMRNARRANSEILSLGQFQQVNVAPFFWNPAFPIGNSFAPPYTDREAIAGINSRPVGKENPATAQRVPNDALNQMMDLSYVLNENLWDRYFLSTIPNTGALPAHLPNSRLRFKNPSAITPAEARNFDTASAHLENIGALNVNSTSVEAWKALLTAFRNLKLGNNPNNTVPIARTLDPIADAIQFTDTDKNAAHTGATATDKNYGRILSGVRYLNDAMIQTLAERIVDEVRLRGPFYSLSDFINRRLNAPSGSGGVDTTTPWYQARTIGRIGATDFHTDWMNPNYDPFIGLHGLSGPLQRAIQVSGINGGVNYPGASSANDRVYTVRLRDTGTEDHIGGSFTNAGMPNNTSSKHTQDPSIRSHLDSEHVAGAPAGEAGQIFDGTPGFVTQGDLLAMIGPALTARGDTFIIRTYGDALNPATLEIQGRAWLEAVVQRTVEPVTPAGTTAPNKYRPTDAFGRRFKIVSFRWLSPEDI